MPYWDSFALKWVELDLLSNVLAAADYSWAQVFVVLPSVLKRDSHV